MRQSTLLIGETLLNKLKEKAGSDSLNLTELLHFLLSDPDLWEKLRFLESRKYTKTYQAEGLNLSAFRFYPLGEDWCFLSVLSNGTGFSRCYIFSYLLEYYLGIRKLKKKVTIIKKDIQNRLNAVLCRVKVNKLHHYLERNLRPKQKPQKITPQINIIKL